MLQSRLISIKRKKNRWNFVFQVWEAFIGWATLAGLKLLNKFFVFDSWTVPIWKMACGCGSKTRVGSAGTVESRNSAWEVPSISPGNEAICSTWDSFLPKDLFARNGNASVYVCTMHIFLLSFNFLICKMVTEAIVSILHLQTPKLLETSWGSKVDSEAWKNGGNGNRAVIPCLASFQSWSHPFPILPLSPFPLWPLPLSDHDWRKRMQQEWIIDKSEGVEEKVNLNVKGKVEPDFPLFPFLCSWVTGESSQRSAKY